MRRVRSMSRMAFASSLCGICTAVLWAWLPFHSGTKRSYRSCNIVQIMVSLACVKRSLFGSSFGGLLVEAPQMLSLIGHVPQATTSLCHLVHNMVIEQSIPQSLFGTDDSRLPLQGPCDFSTFRHCNSKSSSIAKFRNIASSHIDGRVTRQPIRAS
jgi:hypothetical protein